MQHDSALTIERKLPAPWEEDVSFSDVLYEWMHRAPWIGISTALHAVILMILMAIPWELLKKSEQQVIKTDLIAQVEDQFIEPPPEEIEPVEDVETLVEEPQLQSDDVTEEVSDDMPATESELDTPFTSEADFETFGDIGILGIGGGGGTAGHMGPRGFGRGRGGDGTEDAITHALDWLAAHQDDDGKWDSDDFMKHDPAHEPCDGPGRAQHDVGLTGLAVLAFLGEGSTLMSGQYKGNIRRGVQWLRSQQDPDVGLIGQPLGKEFVYDHAIATLALCEAYYFTKSPLYGTPAQKAVNYITRARNPYGAWRYEVPPDGSSDTSVTGWMVLALASAQEAGLEIDMAAFNDALVFLDEMTDPSTGRVGYDTQGSYSSRIERVNDHFPADRGESMTAVGLLCRFFLGQNPDDHPIMREHAELLVKCLPEWDPDGLGNDMYYWYYGSYAMFQMGGKRYWKPWNAALEKAVVESQRKDGSFDGSWDPNGPWGFAGGRIYSTALMALTLEVHYRYSRVLGGR